MTTLTLQEWIERCADRFIKTTGTDIDKAHYLAGVCADSQADSNGASMAEWESPEDAADEEMSYWDDEGEAA